MAGPGSGAAGGALPAVASASASSSAGIPSNARKVVQQLKEVVPGTDDEIYAMLRDCNMDPDETVQRLLNQDPFHEVKRRREKKKELGGNKDGSESRQRPNGPSSRGGRNGPSERGAGRGSGAPRYSSDYNGGGRGKQFVPRENGIHSNNRGSSGMASATASSGSGFSLSKGFPSGASNPVSAPAPIPPTAVAAGPASMPSPAAVPAPASVSAPSLSNGSSVYARTALVGQSWVATSGHATMADIVKSNGAPPPTPPLPAALQPSLPSVAPQQYVTSPPAGSVSSGVYSSSTDPVLHPSLDPRAGTPGTIKRELGSVGNQRPIGDRPSVSVIGDATSISPPSHQSHMISLTATTSGSAPLESEVQVSGPSSPAGTADISERVGNQSALSDVGNGGVVSRQSPGAVQSNVSATTVPRTVLGGGQFNGRSGYQAQQPVGTVKSSGSGLEWKPKPSISSSLGIGSTIGTSSSSVAAPEPTRAPPAPAPAQDASVTASATTKLQGLSIQDEQQVIIPNHLQVPEADQVTGLSFGSFDAGYGTSYSSNFVPEESINSTLPISEAAPLVEPPVEQPSTSVSSPSPVSLSQSFVHQPVASPPESLVASNDVTASPPVPAVQQLELSKPDPVVQQHYPYHGLPPVASYHSFGMLPQIPSPQYSYEPDPAPDVSRLPNIMAYADPTPNYYTPAFRPGADPDRYPAFLASNATSKFNGNIGLQSPQTSQETGSSLPSTGASVQTSQTGNAQPAPSIPQQGVPMHAYTAQAGVPVGHFASIFGYQLVPSNYAYMPHPPYQHSYTGNSGFPQPPAGTSYPQAAGSSYPPAGAGGVKYGLPQYKPGSSSGNVPHSGAGSTYGGYTPTPAGYTSNPTVTAGSASGYEDVPQPYKDNIYIPQQPADGSTVWIQTQLSRDMGGAGLQTSSYYNMPNQVQHAGYSHTQQPTHAHGHPGAGYTNLYHPTQSGPAPSGHQLLQQPQALGATGSGGQAGAYQQPQRTQQTWAANY